MPLNAPRRALPQVEEGGGRRSWRITRGPGVVYIRVEGEGRGLVEVSPQQQRTAYGKCPSYPSQTMMSSE